MSTTATSTNELALLDKSVVVSPLVLLSVVDHYNRVAKDSKKRVVGVILEITLLTRSKLQTRTQFLLKKTRRTLEYGFGPQFYRFNGRNV